jgi:hypothetical protein
MSFFYPFPHMRENMQHLSLETGLPLILHTQPYSYTHLLCNLTSAGFLLILYYVRIQKLS